MNNQLINILYISERITDAENIRTRLIDSGATTELIRVKNDAISKHFGGIMYYFSNLSNLREQAISICKRISDIEVFSPIFIEAPEPDNPTELQPTFSIWVTRTNLKRLNRSVLQELDRNSKNKTVNQEKNVSDSIVPITLPRTDLIACPHCKSMVRPDRLEKHRKNVHLKKELPKNDIKEQKVNQPKIDEPIRPKKNEDQRIILFSRRGTRISHSRPCNACYCLVSVSWHYAESNYGEVYICNRCKAGVFNRSFNKIDAMTLAYGRKRFDKNGNRN